MSAESSELMADSNSIEVILVRMEGKIDRQGDRLSRFENDITGVRGRLHDFYNDLTPLVMLNLPVRMANIDTHNAAIDARLQALENIEQQRKGAAALAKIIYTIAGALGVGGVAAIVRLFQIGGV